MQACRKGTWTVGGGGQNTEEEKRGGRRERSRACVEARARLPLKRPCAFSSRQTLTEAQGLEVALGVGDRCTVTRAIGARRGLPSRPAGKLYSMVEVAKRAEGKRGRGMAAENVDGSSSSPTNGLSPTEARRGWAGRAQ